VLGFDIGGANTKAAFLQTQKGKLQDARVQVEYFPVWKEPEKLSSVLLALKKRLGADRLDGLGVTMTAELSDAYQTKREGVRRILAGVKEAFLDVPIYVLNIDTKLEPVSTAEKLPLGVAAANWAATGWLVAQRVKDCVVVDVGSTSASIIPVSAGQVAAKGKTDLDKLLCGELVYTGSLRTNVAAIVQSIPVKGAVAGVASELFALSADVHLILGNINEKQYTCETADGRGKSVAEALARLARVVCADTEMLTKQEITKMAQYIYSKQVSQVAEGLAKVYKYTKDRAHSEVPVVVTGLGKDFIARKAAEKINAETIIDLESFMQVDAALATPAFAVALLTANKLEGDTIEWTRQ
jgi:hypothetical protein